MFIPNNLGTFQCDQTAFHHPVQLEKKCRYFFRRIDYFYNHRKIAGKAKNFRRMHVARLTKAKGPTQNCGPSETLFARLENDGFIQRETSITIIFTKEDAQQNGFFGQFWRTDPWLANVRSGLCGDRVRFRHTSSQANPAESSDSSHRLGVCDFFRGPVRS